MWWRTDFRCRQNDRKVVWLWSGKTEQLSSSVMRYDLPLRYAFWIECSTLVIVPKDQGPAERHICISHVPVKPSSDSSDGLKSGGGNKNGRIFVWFYTMSFSVIFGQLIHIPLFVEDNSIWGRCESNKKKTMINWPFYEMSTQVARWLTDNIHSDVVPVMTSMNRFC